MPQPEPNSSSENVRVVMRCRPLNQKEIEGGYKNIIKVDPLQNCVTVAPCGDETVSRTFTYDVVFGPDSKQLDVYNEAARPIVENVLEGYNGTIFAYGQTGTGKTFTMEGVRTTPELKGIIPNSFAHVFGHIAKAGDDKKFLVRVSYLEIYNEEIRDLLSKDQNARLEVKERPDVGVFVKDLSAFVVNNADDMDRITTLGNKHRAVATTNMNTHSSRSHAIFTITVENSEKGVDGKQRVRMGKLHLVDLAGSERQSKTGVMGQRFKEATKINLSLSTLGNVISALVDGKSTHVPYRNSKLTRLLQDSLGGNSKTVMIANVGPADYNHDETISTLRYANRAKSIKNNARINEDPKDALLRQFQKEIEELRKQLDEGPEGEVGELSDGDKEESPEADEEQKKTSKKRRNRQKKNVSEDKLAEIRDRITADKKLLEEKKDMQEEERNKIVQQLHQQEEELRKAQDEHDQLVQKLQALEKKIIIGGENLLEKAEEQERLLEESARELEERRKKEDELRLALQQKEAERLDIEEKYSTLQEEAAGKTKKLKKIWSMLMNAKSDLGDSQQEHQREMEGLLENVRQLSRELRLQMIIIDNFIPIQYQDLIERHVHWNEDIGEWQLKCVAYTGNNMRKQSPTREKVKKIEVAEPDLSRVYLSYNSEGSNPHVFTSKIARAKSARPKTAIGKSKSGKKRYSADLEIMLQGNI